MKASCPKCATVYRVNIGYAGLIECKCGVRFDGYSHIHKDVPQARNMVLATTVQCVDIPMFQDVAYDQLSSLNECRPNWLSRNGRWLFSSMKGSSMQTRVIAGIVVCVVVFVALTFFTLTDNSIAVEVMPVAKTVSVPTKAPIVLARPIRNPDNIVFSEIQFNMVGRDTYFLQANLKNSGKSQENWPLIEVTLLSGGRDISQKLVTPLEYLASDVSTGSIPNPSIAPQKTKRIRMNLTFQNDTSKAEDYRMKAVYLEK